MMLVMRRLVRKDDRKAEQIQWELPPQMFCGEGVPRSGGVKRGVLI